MTSYSYLKCTNSHAAWEMFSYATSMMVFNINSWHNLRKHNSVILTAGPMAFRRPQSAYSKMRNSPNSLFIRGWEHPGTVHYGNTVCVHISGTTQPALDWSAIGKGYRDTVLFYIMVLCHAVHISCYETFLETVNTVYKIPLWESQFWLDQQN